MSQRPMIDPLLLATILEAAPGRVRSRLDKQPAAAESWEWQQTPRGFEIRAGEETVSLDVEGDVVRTAEQVRCSCLLSPKCFHILACVNLLKAGGDDAADAAPADSLQDTPADLPVVRPGMQRAASRVRQAVADVLLVGARASGALVQSALLRAGQECRAIGLPMLGNTVLRVVEEVRRVRAQSDLTDSAALRRDLVLALQACELLLQRSVPPPWAFGTSRREFHPLAISRLSGWFAEPILTRSGYAGVAVYLLAPDARTFQIHQARPGDSQLVWQAYTGGIDLGPITATGSELCRSEWAVQNASASIDGRLGRGQSTRWAALGASHWSAGAAAERFQRSLDEQRQTVFQVAGLPSDTRPAGWDLVTLRARVLGASGPALVASVDGMQDPWCFRIAIDDPALPFRDNLQLLARCPGVPFCGIGRLRVESAGEVDLLAIGSPAVEPISAGSPDSGDAQPRLRLPDPWCGLCNLGLDRLQRHHLDGVSRWGVEVTLGDRSGLAANDGLGELDRRLTAIALGGHRALPAIDSQTHRRDVAALRRRNQVTAAELVEALAAARSALMQRDAPTGTRRRDRASSFEAAYLATAVYLQAARLEFHRQNWEQSATSTAPR